MSFIVAIDGPAGSGKGTITEKLSKKLQLINIGTGAAYRCVALETLNKKIKSNEKEKIINLLEDIDIEFKIENNKDTIYLNGEEVSEKIREEAVDNTVSAISAIKEVRIKLNKIFKKCAENKNVIMEGRDIGTVVFPKANVKIYLDAKAEERAKRRYKQNKEKNINQNLTLENILEEINTRDKNDKEKEIGALKIPVDAIYIDSTNMSIQEVTQKIEKIIKKEYKNVS